MRKAWSTLKKITIVKTGSGYEHTSRFEGEMLFWRQTNIHWLVDQFALNSCTLFRRDSGLFSDMYIYTPGKFLKSAVNNWNRFWAHRINIPQLASHNVIIFQKQAAGG